MNDTIKKMKKENLRLTRVHAHTQAHIHTYTHTPTHTHTHTPDKVFVSRKYSSPKILQMNKEKTDNTIFKLGKNPEQVYFTKENLKTANIQLRRFSASLLMREMQIKPHLDTICCL